MEVINWLCGFRVMFCLKNNEYNVKLYKEIEVFYDIYIC